VVSLVGVRRQTQADEAATAIRPTQIPETGPMVADTRSLTPLPPETTQAAPSEPSPPQRRSVRVAETDPVPTQAQASTDIDMDNAPPSAQPPSTARRVSSKTPKIWAELMIDPKKKSW
jgi:hypothetical protein